ncbi:(2Fe-2S)-binding protein [Cyclobacterium sp. 1_MG-2023]|uniref:(2Fe-2S)-binding protein n=1 Tax=Cyclobacterium sp. 1_MG-2023 TaxID=3062681 RepID=UPI0026E2DB24|nr:(2Fe-2S)-binding protein [Cyclobacterium sp. 1_MG-2023]MDO6437591.1 (2Fe-2S)-binding protein [Cyclobacterium sp. 1_MG-2023]
MKVSINGKEYLVEAAGNPSLLEVLRDQLNLTGTKYGCGEGACGACKVLINDTPLPACITPLTSVVGKKIVTIEGLERQGELHPVQKVFLDEDVFQCGFCASGMIISAVALLERKPEAGVQELISGLNGNICRCCTYPAIIDALSKLSQKKAEQ